MAPANLFDGLAARYMLDQSRDIDQFRKSNGAVRGLAIDRLRPGEGMEPGRGIALGAAVVILDRGPQGLPFHQRRE